MKKKNTLFRIAFLTMLFSYVNVWATDYYCNPNGSGSECSNDYPCAYTTAVDSANTAGDRVLFQAGTYDGIDSQHSGEAGNPIVWQCAGERYTVTITNTDSTPAWSNAIRIQHGYITIDGFNISTTDRGGHGIRIDGTVNGTSGPGDYGHRLDQPGTRYYVNGANGITIQNCHITETVADGINGSRNDDFIVQNCTIENTGATGNAIDVLACHNVTIRGNTIDNPGSLAAFAKGGSRNVIFENNIFRNVPNVFAAIALGQDTEWYNTRYLQSELGAERHANVLEWTPSYNQEGDIQEGTATGGGTTSIQDSSATWNTAPERVIPGMHIIKLDGIYYAGYGVVDTVTDTEITFTGPMTEITPGHGGTFFDSGDTYRTRDPISNRGTTNSLVPECRNCIARNNVISGMEGPCIQFQNCYDCAAYNNTCINTGTNQGWVKLWNDMGPWRPSENVRIINNIFYNDSNNPIAWYGYVQDKQNGNGVGVPHNDAGLISDYNVLYDYTQGGNPGLGEIPESNDQNSIGQDPSLDANYRPDATDDPPVNAGYSVATDPLSIMTQDNSDYNTDADGNTRPSEGVCDIGAYEFISSSSHTITASASVGGTISPSGEITVEEGQSRTFTISANSAYAIEDVLVNGNSAGAISSYTFENVTGNQTIAVTFSTVSDDSSGNGGNKKDSGSCFIGSLFHEESLHTF